MRIVISPFQNFIESEPPLLIWRLIDQDMRSTELMWTRLPRNWPIMLIMFFLLFGVLISVDSLLPLCSPHRLGFTECLALRPLMVNLIRVGILGLMLLSILRLRFKPPEYYPPSPV